MEAEEKKAVAVDRDFIFCLERAETRALPVEEDMHESYERLWRDAGTKKQKHKRQESSLVAHLDLDAITDVVEFGCGVASLSAHVAAVVRETEKRGAKEAGEKRTKTEESGNVRFHLLDRASFRSNVRQDKAIRKFGFVVNRCTMDVRDFDFGASVERFSPAEEKEEKRKQFAFISKHFCGFATDCLLRLFVSQSAVSPVQLAVAPCCHGLIQRNLFFGDSAWLESTLGVDLDRLKKVSGWATLNDTEQNNVRDPELGLTREEKKRLGEKAKQLFEEARMRNLPPSVRLVRYTSHSVERLLLTTK